MKKHAVITGATGFVGSNLCRELVKQDWDVSIIVRATSSLATLQDIAEYISIYVHDNEVKNLINFFKEVQPTVVFHVASTIVIEHEAEQIYSLVEGNIQFGLEILEAMKQSNTSLLINTGTSWQHYHTDDYNPVNLYAATKEAFENLLRYYIEVEGIRAVTLKLFDTYGENDERPKLINLLHQFAEEQKELHMSLGEQVIDLVHISDVVQAYIQAVNYLEDNKDISYATFGVGSGKHIQLRDLIALFEQLTGKHLNIVWGGRPYRKREVMEPWEDYRVLPNWHCQVSLEEGLLKYKK